MPDAVEEVLVFAFAEEDTDLSPREGLCERAVVEGVHQGRLDEGGVGCGSELV